MASLTGALGGAATGAKVGALGGPIGIGIGAAAGGLLGLFGGGKPSAEDTAEKAVLGNIPTLISKGNAATDQGLSQLNQSGGFYSSILGGNRDAISNLFAPQTSTILSQYDNAAKAVRDFAPRGGGSTSAQAASPFQKVGTTAQLYQGALPGAAAGLQNNGAITSGVGTALTGQASGAQNGLIDFKKLEEQFQNKAGVGAGQAGANTDFAGIGKGIGSLFHKILGKGGNSNTGSDGTDFFSPSSGSFGDAGDE